MLIKNDSDLSKELNMTHYDFYHTGIRRAEINGEFGWIRSGDEVQVDLEGWYPEYPWSNLDYDFLYWDFLNGVYMNNILNNIDRTFYFICEY